MKQWFFKAFKSKESMHEMVKTLKKVLLVMLSKQLQILLIIFIGNNLLISCKKFQPRFYSWFLPNKENKFLIDRNYCIIYPLKRLKFCKVDKSVTGFGLGKYRLSASINAKLKRTLYCDIIMTLETPLWHSLWGINQSRKVSCLYA